MLAKGRASRFWQRIKSFLAHNEHRRSAAEGFIEKVSRDFVGLELPRCGQRAIGSVDRAPGDRQIDLIDGKRHGDGAELSKRVASDPSRHAELQPLHVFKLPNWSSAAGDGRSG